MTIQAPDHVVAPLRLAVSVTEAASALSIAPRTVRAWIKGGRLHAVRIGRRVVIRVSELERFLATAEREQSTADAEAVVE